MTQVISKQRNMNAETLNDTYGTKWMYVGWTSKASLPRSPLAQPKASRDKKETYRQWLWHQMQIGNTQILNLLRLVKHDTVLIDDCWNAGVANAHIVIKAAQWLREQPKHVY